MVPPLRPGDVRGDLKAYQRRRRAASYLFRPEDELPSGLNDTSERLCIPRVPRRPSVLKAVEAMSAWRPSATGCPTIPGASLYIRPFIIATEGLLGVDASNSLPVYVVVLSPSGAYYASRAGAGRASAIEDVLRPGRAGRHGLCQDRRQLRRLPGNGQVKAP